MGRRVVVGEPGLGPGVVPDNVGDTTGAGGAVGIDAQGGACNSAGQVLHVKA